MDWLTILETAGPAVAGISAVAYAAWRMLGSKDKIIAKKDGEISRVNEARITEKEKSLQQLLSIVQEFNALQTDANETLALLAGQKPKRR